MFDLNNQKQILWTVIMFIVLIFAGSLFFFLPNKSIVPSIILGIFLVGISYVYPRLGLVLFLSYLPWAGTLLYSINGMFSTRGESIYLSRQSYFLFQIAKDLFYFPALVATFWTFRNNFKKYNILFYLFLAISISCLLTFTFVNLNQAFFSKNQQYIAIGLIGIKTIIGYIPLIFFAYFWLRNKQDLYFLFRLFTILTIMACLVCLFQYFLLIDGICLGNTNLPGAAATKATLQARCLAGGSLLYNPAKELLRLPGTFASPWHWAWFLISSAFFAYGIILSEPILLWRIIGTFSVLLVFITSVISGQRTSLLLVPIIFLVLLIITERKKSLLIQKLGVITCLAIISFGQFDFLQKPLENLIQRWNYSSPINFVIEQFMWLLNGKLSLLGNGIGIATSGARLLGHVGLIETFQVKVIYEIGILGSLTYLVILCTVLILTFRAYQSLQDPKLRQLSLCLWSFLLLITVNPYYYPLAVDPVNVYYWLIAGVLLKLPEIESEEITAEEIDHYREV